jgi:hypothetical protein
VRGGKEDQNLILLDNALLYNPAHFFGFFGTQPLHDQESRHLQRLHPAEFGGRLSSVFDITTKNASFDKFNGEGGNCDKQHRAESRSLKANRACSSAQGLPTLNGS